MKEVKIMKRNIFYLVLGLTALVFAGCKDKKQPVDPFVTPGTTENPNWVITVENDLSNSMTVVAKVSFTDQPGVLAAFNGNDCCGIGEYKAEYGLYWLYISPASEAGGNVQLRFYSPNLKRIFDATETFPFQNQVHMGSVAAPYTPTWKAN